MILTPATSATRHRRQSTPLSADPHDPADIAATGHLITARLQQAGAFTTPRQSSLPGLSALLSDGRRWLNTVERATPRLSPGASLSYYGYYPWIRSAVDGGAPDYAVPDRWVLRALDALLGGDPTVSTPSLHAAVGDALRRNIPAYLGSPLRWYSAATAGWLADYRATRFSSLPVADAVERASCLLSDRRAMLLAGIDLSADLFRRYSPLLDTSASQPTSVLLALLRLIRSAGPRLLPVDRRLKHLADIHLTLSTRPDLPAADNAAHRLDARSFNLL